MDLDMRSTTSPAAKVYYGRDANRFVITYLNARAFGSTTDSITFQIILQQNGRIKIQYDDAHSTTSASSDISIDALIGLENNAGTLGVEYRNDGAGGPIFGSPLAIEFGTNPDTLPVEDFASTLPYQFALSQNYPNPFNPATTIAFELPVDADVDLAVYDVLGRKVAQLVDGRMSAGYHPVGFSVSDREGMELASGVYLCRLAAGDFVRTRKLLLRR